MQETRFRRVEAIHPHWSGILLLSTTDNAAAHEGHESRGTYDLTGSQLTVFWDHHPPDVFFEKAGRYIHRILSSELPDADRLSRVAVGGAPVRVSRLSVLVPDHDYEVALRLGTSDTQTFGQVFINRDYDSRHLPERADTIVDLGGNVGYATVFFALRYPGARLLAVEPEPGNFAALVGNTAGLGPRVQAVQAAAWTHDGLIHLQTQMPDGSPMGSWAFRVSEARAQTITPCFTLRSLFDRCLFADVDILKVDIEGAELDLFSQTPPAVLRRAALIMVETHDRFRPGSEATVRAALAADFDELPRSGENLLFRRRPSS